MIFGPKTGKSLFLASIILGLSACASTLPQDPDKVASVPDLQRVFARLATGFGKDGNDQAWPRKWTMPLRIKLVNQQDKDDFARVRQAFREIGPYIGLTIEMPPKTGPANFLVQFVKRENLEKELRKRFGPKAKARKIHPGTICYALPRGRNRIISAEIFVAYDIGNKVKNVCILHELLHALGLIGHHRVFAPSMLYNRDITKQAFSINDQILLRALYDRSIIPGMTHAQAARTGKSLIVRFHQKLAAGVSPKTVLKFP